MDSQHRPLRSRKAARAEYRVPEHDHRRAPARRLYLVDYLAHLPIGEQAALHREVPRQAHARVEVHVVEMYELLQLLQSRVRRGVNATALLHVDEHVSRMD